eukprot:INCI19566.1.p1 GENE.INCI19566.1~~INCI19566.1.p1  ORF type:complete len:448 (+),score=68.78 INCI19566.1:237-1580(+)
MSIMKTLLRFCGVSALATVGFLVLANMILEQPRFPATLDPALVPHRPALLRIINAFGGLGSTLLGIDPLPDDVAAFEQAAISATGGLTDFGNLSYRPGLKILLDSLHREARLSFFGKVLLGKYIMRNLVKRLELTAYWEEHPDALEEKIENPIIIAGLPRTGTTLMHNMLLAGGPNDFRTPLRCEIDFPTPPPSKAIPKALQFKIDVSQLELSAFKLLAPDFDSFHPVDAYLPEECTMIFGSDFKSIEYPTLAYAPTYFQWLGSEGSADIDNHDILIWHEHWLKHLQSNHGRHEGRQWLLKAIQYYYLLEEVFERYPDAKVIHMHRDPNKVMHSISAVNSKLFGVTSDDLDPLAIGKFNFDYYEAVSKKQFEWRKSNAEAIASGKFKVLDIFLGDVKDNTEQVIDQILDFIGRVSCLKHNFLWPWNYTLFSLGHACIAGAGAVGGGA